MEYWSEKWKVYWHRYDYHVKMNTYNQSMYARPNSVSYMISYSAYYEKLIDPTNKKHMKWINIKVDNQSLMLSNTEFGIWPKTKLE